MRLSRRAAAPIDLRRRLRRRRVREIRDEIEQRVRDFVQTRVEGVRTGETAHRLRLQKLIPSLVEEDAQHKGAVTAASVDRSSST